MLNSLNQSIHILPQQEELAYRIVILANYIGDISSAKQDLELLTSLGSITTNGELMLRKKIRDAQEKQFQEILDAQKEIIPKMRNDRIFYSVGHVFRHARSGYRGVIYGWHFSCPEESQVFTNQGDELNLEELNQPFYMVLVDTRNKPQQTAIVSQINIIIEPGDIVEHPEVGYYFTAFRAGNYIPNAMLQKEYPFDEFSNFEVIPLTSQQSSGIKRTASNLY